MSAEKETVIQEIERRFLVLEWDKEHFRERLASNNGHKKIQQGYILSPEGRSRRIRITNADKAEMTQKTGSGLSRKEENVPIPDAQFAYKMMRFFCEDCLAKKRVVENGFEIDVYEGPLAGLVIVEKELASEDEPVEKPEWVKEWVEVTYSLTNQQLARLATELSHAGEPLRHADLIAPSIPMIVLTGGPCSGKSSLMEHLRRDPVFGTSLHFVPEVATILISQVGIRPDPGDPMRFKHFQRTLYRVQRAFEELARLQALKDGKKAVLLDRGTMDAAAYLPRGILSLEQLCETEAKIEYQRYHAVAVLEMPTSEVYEANKGNNAARRESYTEAEALGRNIENAWHEHPQYKVIGKNAKDWETKRSEGISFLLSTIKL